MSKIQSFKLADNKIYTAEKLFTHFRKLGSSTTFGFCPEHNVAATYNFTNGVSIIIECPQCMVDRHSHYEIDEPKPVINSEKQPRQVMLRELANRNHDLFGDLLVFYMEGEQKRRALVIRKCNNTIEVEPMDDDEKFKTFLYGQLNKLGPTYTTDDADNLLKVYFYSGDLYRNDLSVKYVAESTEGTEEEPVYTYKIIEQVDASPDRSQLTYWNHFLNRISDADAFAAWIWSCYESRHKGRQFLYLEGSEGLEGKSIMIKAIQNQFGSRYATSINTHALSLSNTFALYGCLGKRLITIPEVGENVPLLKYSNFKAITGGDNVKLEKKFGQPLQAIIDCRIIATSNYPLTIGNESFETSRTLWLTIAPFEGYIDNLQDKLENEYPLFLRYAKWCYQQRCSNHYEIVSEDSKARIEAISIGSAENVLEDYASCFEINPTNLDWFISRKDFNDTLKLHNGGKSLPSQLLKEIKSALVALGITDCRGENGYRKTINDKRIKGYRGIRVKTAPASYFSTSSAQSQTQPTYKIQSISEEELVYELEAMNEYIQSTQEVN